MFETILVPVDLSDNNDRSVTMAGQLAERANGVVHLLHVIETIPGLDTGEEQSFFDRLERAAKKYLERLGSNLGEKDRRWKSDVVYGSRAATILSEAGRLSADLIVMRSHQVDRGGLKDGWGTLSYQIGIFATCPVLLVK